MARRHKHEEHQNHERWVISYADMITLLFALFVVLYALGEIKLKNLKDVTKSIAFAFHFEGSGKTQEQGLHDKGQDGTGVLPEAAPLINSQKEAMREYLQTQLTERFEEVAGTSLEIVQTDDTIAFRAPLSSFFGRGQRFMSTKILEWLSDLVAGAMTISSDVRIRIEAPNVVIGQKDNGTATRSPELCHQRLDYLHSMTRNFRGVPQERITTEFRVMAANNRDPRHWEDQGTVVFAFSTRSINLDEIWARRPR